MQGKWIKTIFKVIALIVLFACISQTNSTPRKTTLIESFVSDLISFPQRVYANAKAYVASDEAYFKELETLRKENEELKTKLEEYEKFAIDYEQVTAENEVMRSHLKLAEKYKDYNLVVADIISDSATNWEATYIINKGSKDGIKPGMTVITHEGLVGYVETVTNKTSKIISILDAGNSVSSRVSRTRDEVVCKGSISSSEKQELNVMNIPMWTILIEGDRVETSGVGGIYPKGINIGKIVEIVNKKNPIENEAIVKTDVDFNKLETVGVVVFESEDVNGEETIS